jgi:exopolysaccharide production protein ExoZ
VQHNVTFSRIQVLRFVAAAAVVVYHAQLTAVTYFGGTAPLPILEYGTYGVDLFFVISGFIIVFIASTRETNAAMFTRRRIERIVPLYWIMTLATFALTHIPGLARNAASDPLHLVQSLLFLSWLDGYGTYPVLNVGWTLEFEMLFYAIAAAAMAWTRRPWAVTAFVMLALVLTGRGSFFFLQNPMIIEFVFGMTIATFLYDRRLFPWLLGSTLLVLVTLPLTQLSWRVWAIGLPSSVLVGAAVYADRRKAYRGRVLPELGNASYSIYLTHVIAISFACKMAIRLMPSAPLAIIVPLISVFSVVIGYMTYCLVEKRLIALGRKRRPASLAPRPSLKAELYGKSSGADVSYSDGPCVEPITRY